MPVVLSASGGHTKTHTLLKLCQEYPAVVFFGICAVVLLVLKLKRKRPVRSASSTRTQFGKCLTIL